MKSSTTRIAKDRERDKGRNTDRQKDREERRSIGT